MSAQIPSTMLLSDLLKPTGYNCPDDLQGKTFDEATSGGTEVVLEDNKLATITENGTVEITPSTGKDGMKKVTATVNVPSNLEANKEATITTNGTHEITPTEGKDGMEKATVTVNVAGGELNPENLWFHGFTDEWSQLAGFITDKEVLADGVKGVFVCYDGKDPSYKAFATSAKIVVSNDVVSLENLDPEEDDLPNSPHTYTGAKMRLYSIDFGA